jgi:hypothetical protein
MYSQVSRPWLEQRGYTSYDITAENATSIGLPGEFGQSTLVIDDADFIYHERQLKHISS